MSKLEDARTQVSSLEIERNKLEGMLYDQFTGDFAKVNLERTALLCSLLCSLTHTLTLVTSPLAQNRLQKPVAPPKSKLSKIKLGMKQNTRTKYR